MKTKYFIIVLVMTMCLLIAGCLEAPDDSNVTPTQIITILPQGTPTELSVPSYTPISTVLPPTTTPTVNPSPKPTLTPTIRVPVSLGTKIPFDLEEINQNNISRLKEIANLGSKQLEKFYFAEQQNELMVSFFNTFIKIKVDDLSFDEISINSKGEKIISPDFSRFISRETDTVALWDVKGQLITNIRPQKAGYWISTLLFSPDGNYFVLSEISFEGTNYKFFFSFYEAITGKFLFNSNVYTFYNMYPLGLSVFSPDSSKFLYADEGENSLEIWDIKGKEITSKIYYDRPCSKMYRGNTNILESSYADVSRDTTSCLHFSPDGKYLVISENRKNTILVTETLETYLEIPKGQSQFSKNGQYLLVNDGFTASRVWDIPAKKMVYSIGNKGGVSFSNNSRFVAFLDPYAPDISILDLSTMKETSRIPEFDWAEFSDNNQFLVVSTSAWNNKSSAVYENETGRLVYSGPNNSCEIFIPFSSDFLVSCDFGNFIWDVENNSKQKDFQPGKVIWIPGSRYFILLTEDNLFQYDQNTFELIGNIPFEADPIFRTSGFGASTPDKIIIHQNMLYAPGVSGMKQIDLTSMTTMNIFPRGTSFSENSSTIAIPTQNGISIFQNDKLIAELPLVDVKYFVISPSGTYLAANKSVDGIDVWEISSKQVLYTLKTNPAPFVDIAFSKDERYIFADQYFNAGYTYYAWDVKTGIRQIQEIAYRFMPLSVSHDGRKLAVKNDFENIHIYDLTSNGIKLSKAITLQLTSNSLPSVAFSSDGKILAIPQRKMITFILIETSETVFELDIAANYEASVSIDFSEDGKYFVVSGPDGIQVYGVPISK